MGQDLDTALATINAELGGPYRIDLVALADLEPAPKNARFMPPEKFRNLVDNLKRDGALGSVPLLWRKPDGKLRVLSGNHRVDAAVQAGLERALALVIEEKLDRDRELAIQLSHNSLSGQDDPVVLRELYEEIASLELAYYSGLDDKTLEQLGKVNLPALGDVGLAFRQVSFVFLPPEVERLEAVLKEALDLVPNREVFAARIEDFDRAITAVTKASDAWNVRNTATALMLVLDVFEAHKTDLAAGWTPDVESGRKDHQRSWVPLDSIIGRDTVPLSVANVLRKAVETMVSRDEVSGDAPWQALEFWAAEYLAGPDAGPDEG